MTTKQKNQTKISRSIQDTETYMRQRVGVGTSFDAEYREIVVLETKVQLYYLNGLVDDASIIHLLKKLVDINDYESEQDKVWQIIENRLVNQQVDITENMDEAVDEMLSGLIAVFVDGYKQAFIIDVRFYPGRTPEEPDTERVIRGSRDGYTENVIENTALTRRRIRDERLRHEMLRVGERSKTDVCVCYLQDVANDDLVDLVKDKVREIEVDGITMADKAVEEFMLRNRWNPYPLVRYTERPDVAADHMLDGHVVLIIDTSPSVIILPTTFFDQMEHAEEYRQTPAVGTFIRWIRILAMLISLYLLPLWLLFVLDPSLLPKNLSYIGPNEEGNVPVVMQIILANIGVELLRMAAVHTPTPLATALGLIAAILIGEIAVEVGMFTPEVILYVAISTVGDYVIPSYELSVANKIMKFFLIIITAIFGVSGFMIGIVINILYLSQLKSLRVPYLWPFIPFDARAMLYFLCRIPVPFANKRPSFVHPKNIYRQPAEND